MVSTTFCEVWKSRDLKIETHTCICIGVAVKSYSSLTFEKSDCEQIYFAYSCEVQASNFTKNRLHTSAISLNFDEIKINQPQSSLQ